MKEKNESIKVHIEEMKNQKDDTQIELKQQLEEIKYQINEFEEDIRKIDIEIQNKRYDLDIDER